MRKTNWYWNEDEDRIKTKEEIKLLESETKEYSRLANKRNPQLISKRFWKTIAKAWKKGCEV